MFAGIGVPLAQGGIVAFQNGGYLLNPCLNVWTDVAQFESNVKMARCHERAGRLDAALELYTKAEQLYRGDLFEDDRFEEWMQARRENLKDTYLFVLDKLSEQRVRQGEHDHALELWKAILSRDACREDTYRRLMEAYARLGQRSVALNWYEVCVQTLCEQLDAAPEPETVALAERIRANVTVDHSPNQTAR